MKLRWWGSEASGLCFRQKDQRARALKLPWWSVLPSAGIPDLIPSSGKRSHMLQLSSSAAAEIWHATKKDPTPHAATRPSAAAQTESEGSEVAEVGTERGQYLCLVLRYLTQAFKFGSHQFYRL